METTYESYMAREDRVRAVTDPEINRELDEQLRHRLQLYSCQDAELISQRIRELDEEWDMERTLEANASSLALTGLCFGTVLSRKWYVVPMLVTGFLLQHSIQGWCPPVRFFRRRGVRTRQEIEKERYALKIMRGDFESVSEETRRDVNRILAMLER